MLICFDYDHTYTEDPDLWNSIIEMMTINHEVICCSMRYKEEGLYLEETIGQLCKVFYSGRKAKKPYLLSIGLEPDIWIEDTPEFILYDVNCGVKRPGQVKEKED